MASNTKRDIPPVLIDTPGDLKKTLLAYREALQVLMGKRGADDDAAVRWSDLSGSRFSSRIKGGSGGTVIVGGGGGGGSGGGGGGTYVPDLTPPPDVTGISISAGISSVIIQWDAPTYTQGHGNKRTLIYAVKKRFDDVTIPVWSEALKPYAEAFQGLNIIGLPSEPKTRWHVWLKYETVDGVLSPNPMPATISGASATTGQDVSLLLSALTGQIRASELNETLGARIDLIDGPATTPNTVAARIKVESDARTTLDGNVRALYTVRTEVSAGGRTIVGGFGLAGTANGDEGPRIDFGVRADAFFVEAPAGSGQPTSKMVPFVVRTTETIENGVTIPAGTYMNAAFIVNLTAMYARMQKLVADDIVASDISVAKLTAGTFKVGSYIKSADYTAGVNGQGYKLSRDGIELPATSIRGQLVASQIKAWGLSIYSADGTREIIKAGSAKPITSDVVDADAGWLNSNVGGVNMVWAASSVTAAQGDYGARLTHLRSPGFNPHGLKPGEKLTISAEVWQDGAAASVGQYASLYLYCMDAAGNWTGSTVTINGSGQTPVGSRGSATLTLPADDKMQYVTVDIYHHGGTGANVGLALADRIQVERGSTATQYKPGAQPGATVGATWGVNVGGDNKPLDNASKVIDLGGDSSTTPGARGANDPPSFYKTGVTRQFKVSAAVGLGGAENYLTLETVIQYPDGTGGSCYQYAYRGTTTWRRWGTCGADSWAGGWVQDLDRNAYTGDLDATKGATWGLNLNSVPTNLAQLAGTEDIKNSLLTPAIQAAAQTANWGNISNIPAFGTFATLNQITAENADTVISGAIIGLANIKTATITNLAALNSWTGNLTVGDAASPGFIRGGQTDFATGAGFFMGFSGGAPKISIGDANQYFRWSPAGGLEISFPPFNGYSREGDLSVAVGNGYQFYGLRHADTNGGRPPLVYSWNIENMTGNGNIYIGSANGQSVSIQGFAFDAILSATISCTITDANNRVTYAYVTVTGYHGTPP